MKGLIVLVCLFPRGKLEDNIIAPGGAAVFPFSSYCSSFVNLSMHDSVISQSSQSELILILSGIYYIPG